MLRRLFIAIAALVAFSGYCGLRPVAPAPLHTGDTIAIISPASTPKDGVAEAAAQVLEQWGFHAIIGEHAYNHHAMYAGTTGERIYDLLMALRNPNVKAIICTRGGYGASQLLYALDPGTFNEYPKWIVGYSDICSLHSAQVRNGNMSIHANMCGYLGSHDANDPLSLMLRDVLIGKRPTYTVPAHRLNHKGEATGMLIGGNMSVLSNISGSPEYDFFDRDYTVGSDIILFIEDVGESMPRVLSMLYQLKLKKVIDRVKGIVVGRFTDYTPSEGYGDMADLLDEYLQGYEIPICYDFPASHDEDWNYPLIEGCPVKLTVDDSGVTLKFLEY